jgi:DNA-directed RNA polymerase subunit RPC12/RpoP
MLDGNLCVYSSATHNFDYVCGHCGRHTSGRVIARDSATVWLRCTSCLSGSVQVENGNFFPTLKFGQIVEHLPDMVHTAFDEARICFSNMAYTASDLLCRKIIMNVAVDKGADEGLKFVQYIDYLVKVGHITPSMRVWVKIIKDNGNDATHKIEISDKRRAETTLTFTTQLLKILYEMPAKAQIFASEGSSEV